MIDYPYTSSQYDWKGRLIDEPDDGEPTQRRHCSKCGGFLSKEPQEVTRDVPVDWDYTYEQGEVSGYVVHRTEQEIEPIWACKKCGHEHDADEMYR